MAERIQPAWPFAQQEGATWPVAAEPLGPSILETTPVALTTEQMAAWVTTPVPAASVPLDPLASELFAASLPLEGLQPLLEGLLRFLSTIGPDWVQGLFTAAGVAFGVIRGTKLVQAKMQARGGPPT